MGALQVDSAFNSVLSSTRMQNIAQILLTDSTTRSAAGLRKAALSESEYIPWDN
jgi:hypothetical protein